MPPPRPLDVPPLPPPEESRQQLQEREKAAIFLSQPWIQSQNFTCVHRSKRPNCPRRGAATWCIFMVFTLPLLSSDKSSIRKQKDKSEQRFLNQEINISIHTTINEMPGTSLEASRRVPVQSSWIDISHITNPLLRCRQNSQRMTSPVTPCLESKMNRLAPNSKIQTHWKPPRRSTILAPQTH